ncbi:SDR family NAD(P)-dependent oxidoreductase [Methylobacterium radiodurans]|uniref:Cyclopentanol dehydrogenase n=1 Tax=Methylobacterium radiodurans TaxID=2202828 RepID=A0A2U8VX44_9HYPH|nr:SDR family oxidoreductase [Methylobacterium radiodurans]AWN38355.1 cyclopentanol dehydrogenase [Methylobacterium radiodurans]
MDAFSDLRGKAALVTGGSRGQGAAQARLLAQSGVAVTICDVLADVGETYATSLRDEGLEVRFQAADVTAPEGWDALVAGALAWRSRLDILVNNAGIINRTGVAATDLTAWNRVLAVNLTGAFLGIRAVAPAMRDAGGGSIVNIASNSAFSGHADPAYTASKWGLRGLTKTAAMELVADRIRVNAVCPGLVVTGLNAGSPHLAPMIGLTPMGRAGEPDEVARLVRFLASEEASFITGEDFVIDGGFTAGAAYRRVAVETSLL